jgi:hypothetical protein
MDELPRKYEQLDLGELQQRAQQAGFASLDGCYNITEVTTAGNPLGEELTDDEPPVPETTKVGKMESDRPQEDAVAEASGKLVTPSEVENATENPVNEEEAPAPDELVAPDMSSLASSRPKPETPTRHPEENRPDEPPQPPDAAAATESEERKDQDDPRPERNTPPDINIAQEKPSFASLHVRDCTEATLEVALPEAKNVAEDEDYAQDDPDAVHFVLGERAKQAVDEGQQDEADELVGLLDRLPATEDEEVAVTLHTLAGQGNTQAEASLRLKLAEDMMSAQEKVDTIHTTQSGIAYPPIHQPVLENIVKACEANGTDPDKWIDEFSLSPESQWLTYMRHNLRVYKPTDSAPDPEGYQKISDQVDQLGNKDQLPPDFVTAKAAELIRAMPTIELRERVLTHFMAAKEQQPPSLPGFRRINEVAVAVLNDDDLATSERVGALTARIDQYREDLQNKGPREYTLNRVSFIWDISRKKLEGASPPEVVRHMDLLTGQLLSSKGAPESTSSQNDVIMGIRDSNLGTYAHESASAGDFDDARLYLSGIASDVIRTEALMRCLEKTTDEKHVNDLRPDALTLAENPRLERQFAAAQALASQDIGDLSHAAVNIAAHFKTTVGEADTRYIQRVFESVAQQDQEAGLKLAEKIATELRQREANWAYIEPYSAVLINANRTREIPRVMQDILRITDRRPVQAARALANFVWHLDHPIVPPRAA